MLLNRVVGVMGAGLNTLASDRGMQNTAIQPEKPVVTPTVFFSTWHLTNSCFLLHRAPTWSLASSERYLKADRAESHGEIGEQYQRSQNSERPVNLRGSR